MSKELFAQLDYWIDKHGGLGIDTPLPLLIQQLKAENERLAQTAEVIETQFHERLEDELKPLQQEIAQLQQQFEQAEMERDVAIRKVREWEQTGENFKTALGNTVEAAMRDGWLQGVTFITKVLNDTLTALQTNAVEKAPDGKAEIEFWINTFREMLTAIKQEVDKTTPKLEVANNGTSL